MGMTQRAVCAWICLFLVSFKESLFGRMQRKRKSTKLSIAERTRIALEEDNRQRIAQGKDPIAVNVVSTGTYPQAIAVTRPINVEKELKKLTRKRKSKGTTAKGVDYRELPEIREPMSFQWQGPSQEEVIQKSIQEAEKLTGDLQRSLQDVIYSSSIQEAKKHYETVMRLAEVIIVLHLRINGVTDRKISNDEIEDLILDLPGGAEAAQRMVSLAPQEAPANLLKSAQHVGRLIFDDIKQLERATSLKDAKVIMDSLLYHQSQFMTINDQMKKQPAVEYEFADAEAELRTNVPMAQNAIANLDFLRKQVQGSTSERAQLQKRVLMANDLKELDELLTELVKWESRYYPDRTFEEIRDEILDTEFGQHADDLGKKLGVREKLQYEVLASSSLDELRSRIKTLIRFEVDMGVGTHKYNEAQVMEVMKNSDFMQEVDELRKRFMPRTQPDVTYETYGDPRITCDGMSPEDYYRTGPNCLMQEPLPPPQKKQKRSRGHPKGVPVVGDGVEIRPSTIPNAGNGLFAMKDFHPNDVVTEYWGELIDWETARQLRLQGKDTHIKSLESQATAISAPTQAYDYEGQGGGGMANAALAPPYEQNATWLKTYDEKDREGRTTRLWLQATKHIPADSEIFVSYDRDYWDVERVQPEAPTSTYEEPEPESTPVNAEREGAIYQAYKAFMAFMTRNNMQPKKEQFREMTWDAFVKDSDFSLLPTNDPTLGKPVWIQLGITYEEVKPLLPIIKEQVPAAKKRKRTVPDEVKQQREQERQQREYERNINLATTIARQAYPEQAKEEARQKREETLFFKTLEDVQEDLDNPGYNPEKDSELAIYHDIDPRGKSIEQINAKIDKLTEQWGEKMDRRADRATMEAHLHKLVLAYMTLRRHLGEYTSYAELKKEMSKAGYK